MSDMIVVMRDGLIQQQGRPNELYERPTNAFVANFIGVSNFIPARLVEGARGEARAVVETASGRRMTGHVTDPAAIPEPGASVTVAIRPERLRVIRADEGEAGTGGPGEAAVEGDAADRPAAASGTGASEPGWTAIRGRVRQGTYLGDQTEFRIETSDAGELIVRRQNVAGAGSAGGVGPGDPVLVSWHEEANLILVG